MGNIPESNKPVADAVKGLTARNEQITARLGF
jgi:hypothetical protein